MQSVKAITTFLGQVETLEITAACDDCLKACLEFDKAKGNFCEVTVCLNDFEIALALASLVGPPCNMQLVQKYNT